MARIGVRDVARAAGVSVGTVSHVLNHREKVAADTVARVDAAIAELGFVRNGAARQLRSGRSLTVGAVVLDAANPFFADVIRGAEEQADASEHAVLVGTSGADEARERRYLDLFSEQGADGILLSPAAWPPQRLAQIAKRGTPVVLVDAQPEGSALPSVAVDDVAGGALAVSHLIGAGRRRIGFVGGPHRIRQVADRWTGAQQAAELAGGNVELERFDTPATTVLAGRAAGEQLIMRPAPRRPDALFCANDLVAVGVMQALVLAGAAIPDDIALIGYDDIDFAAATMVALSSVRQPARELGATAVRMLLGEDDRTSVTFAPELVVRESTDG
ncbi:MULTISPECIES: LacI family DNA-binding transcriptional regulator [Brevibacterium]|uniref:LacI family DNA-binding transcriptional regulator n=1 Tax=Brevibacterium TaxID=1696 RepID=UPI0022805DC9|nr:MULTISPECIES: LacI family DNA-binding transcriptional regulator [Brevibacterium]WAL40646.1 LacI family DNA-binding transcriptional regulator [Brevibacterium sp. BRM-1]